MGSWYLHVLRAGSETGAGEGRNVLLKDKVR
jgi:hypothetical protein